MRETKVMQIFEGTNQIQRLVISRSLPPPSRAASLREVVLCRTVPRSGKRNRAALVRRAMDQGQSSAIRTYFWRANPLAAPILAAAAEQMVWLIRMKEWGCQAYRSYLGLSHLAQAKEAAWALPAGWRSRPVDDALPARAKRGVMIRALRSGWP